jgi:hypothetical protein
MVGFSESTHRVFQNGVSSSLATTSVTNKHDSETDTESLKELHNLLKERLPRLPVELGTTLGELLKDFGVVGLRQHTGRE